MNDDFEVPVADKRGGVTLPPGTYVIGDPCYQLNDEQWEEVLYESDDFESPIGVFNRQNGGKGFAIAFSTAYGDGLYNDLDDREYGVDSGLIGIIPVDQVDNLDDTNANVITFTSPFTCKKIKQMLVFGHIEINVSGDVEDPYEEEVDDDDEY
jgi:hypothetical protein